MSGDCRILWRDRKEEGKPVQSGERGRVWLVGAARGTLLTDWGRAVSCHVGVQAVARTPLLAVLYRRGNPCAVSTLHWSLRLFLSSSSSSFSPSLFSSIFQWWKGRGFHVSGISGIGEALTRAEIKCDKPVFLKGIRLYDNKTRKERLLYLLPFFPGNVAVNAESQEGLVSLLSPLIGAGRSGTNLGRIEHQRAPGQCFTSWLDNHSTFWVYPFAHWDYLYIVAVQYLILQTVGKR